MSPLLLAAPASGTGKTTVTCALLSALKKRGLNPCAFKCGPDYIDPMFHRSVLGVESHNLDLFLSDEDAARQMFARNAAGHGAAVCEGAMGLYDGVGGNTDRASAWHVADTLDLPILLVVRPKGASLTLAAQIKGLQAFRPDSHIRGIILNDCKEMLGRTLAPMLEKETGIPVLGWLPKVEQAEVQSRHLGLYTAGEVQDISGRIDRVAEELEQHLDMDRLLDLCRAEDLPAPEQADGKGKKAAIAVARDEAFCFTYAETLEALELAGAEIVPFSPLHDDALPEGVGGLYLPGGYPELYARELAENSFMREAICKAVEGGLPTVAECGGFLYLGKTLRDEENRPWPMAGVLPGEGFPAGKLVRFGYAHLKPEADSLLFRKGEEIPIHEFHYWDSTENGDAFTSEKPVSGRKSRCGFVSKSLYAAFPHLYFGGHPRMAERFVQAAEAYGKTRG